MKIKNLLFTCTFLLSGQLFFSCNSARYYEFSNNGQAYHTENAVVKTDNTDQEKDAQDITESNILKPAPLLTADAGPTISPAPANHFPEVYAAPSLQAGKKGAKINMHEPDLKPVNFNRKDLRKTLKNLKNQSTTVNRDISQPDVDAAELILAIFLPPVGVLLHEGGINDRFWIALILTLLGFLPGVVYAILVVTDTI